MNRYFGEGYVMSFALIGVIGTADVHVIDVHAYGYGEDMRLMAYIDGEFYRLQEVQRSLSELKEYVMEMFRHPNYVWRMTDTWIEAC